jgi:hypothetical protein
MNSDPSKLRQQQEVSQQSAANLQSESQPHEFGSVEEMIRFDSGQTPAPDEVAQRLKETISREGPPRRPWWRRLVSSISRL